MPEAERWEHTLTRRLRSLVRTAPVHRVEASKASRGRDLGPHDLRGLALRVIDSAIEHMGLGYGARRSDLYEALTPLLTAAEPGLSTSDIAEISDVVIDSLLNEPNRRLAFDEPYLSWVGAHPPVDSSSMLNPPSRATVRARLTRSPSASKATITRRRTSSCSSRRRPPSRSKTMPA